MYIFWDNPNIHYDGFNSMLPIKEPDVDSGSYRPTSKAC